MASGVDWFILRLNFTEVKTVVEGEKSERNEPEKKWSDYEL